MAALLGMLLAAAAPDGADVEALQRLWSGVRDSSEHVVMSVERGASGWPQTSEQRVRTIVAPVSVAWLGAHVLYLEEFLEDDPEDPRRQRGGARSAPARNTRRVRRGRTQPLRNPRRTRARADAARPRLAVRARPRCSHPAAAGAGP